MRIAVFSDLHANAAALKAVLRDIDARAPDRVIVLGDLAGRGPRPRKVIDVVAERALPRTRGRWDRWLAGDAGGVRPERELRMAERLLRKRDHAFLASAPDVLRERFEGASVLFSHAGDITFEPLISRWTPAEELSQIFDRREADVIVLGAAEPAFVRSVGPRLLINTGSAGFPITGDPRATFALLELAAGEPPRAEIVRVPYALEKTIRRVDRAVRRGRMEPDLAAEYRLALLGGDAEDEDTLDRRLAGPDLAIALLARRIARVYSAGSKMWPEDDFEHVHALRVATRRLREALALSAPMLGSVRRLDRRAQRFGRALGARRTVDVFIEQVEATRSAGAEGLDGFLAFLEARRDAATVRIQAAYPSEKLVNHGLKLLTRTMNAAAGRSLDELAAAHLEARAERVDARLPSIEIEEATAAHHGLRIALKHLRYAFEILAPAYPDALDPAASVAPIKALQDALGALNDQGELIALAQERLSDETAVGEERDALAKFVGSLEEARRAGFQTARAEVAKQVPAVLAEAHAVAARLLRLPRP